MTPPELPGPLTRLRPPTHAFDDEWRPAQRDTALAEILAADRRSVDRRAPRRRSLTAGAIAACTAAVVGAGIVLPHGSPGGPDSAAALEQLALDAGTAGGAVGPGQYAYVAEQQTQVFSAYDVAHGTPPVSDHHFRTWTGTDGATWTADRGCLDRTAYDGATAAQGSYGTLDAAALADLPTSPGPLGAFFDAHPSGDNRGARNRFLSVGDLLRSALAPPALRAAALRVLADTDDVTVDPDSRDASDGAGRPAVRVDYSAGDYVESLYFDPDTSALLEEQTTENGAVTFRSVVTDSRVVDSLPDLPRCG